MVGGTSKGPAAAAAALLVVDRSTEVVSVERTRRGFRVHCRGREPWAVRVRKRDRREVEARIRAVGIVVVDEWGAQIDASQFEKEADPAFRKLRTNDDLPSAFLTMLTPNWYLGWRHRRLLRQSSDDA